ncbi:MAG: ABC transporter permease [Oligoflexia bacterium]|nr:ABC transporter permease [Oligoflexia bacterium]
MMKVFLKLIQTQFKELLRDPGVLFWGIGFPILMAIGLSIAFSPREEVNRIVSINKMPDINLSKEKNTTLDGQEILVYQSTISSQSIGRNRISFYVTSDNLIADTLLKRGIVQVMIAYDDIHNSYHYSFDPKNPEAQLTYLIVRAQLEKNGLPATNEGVTAMEVPGTRYVDFLLPGLVAMGVMMSCMWGLSYGLIERRSKKLLRRLVATPMRKSTYLLSLIFVRVLFAIFEAAILIFFAMLFLGFKVHGSWSLLLLIFLAGHWAFSGLAILVASRTTVIEIGTGIINTITTPMIVLSGVFFSYENFPSWAKLIIKYLPLTVVTDGYRRVMLEGASVESLQIYLVALFLFGTITFLTGLKIFKWY